MAEKQVYPTGEIPHLWAHGNGATETKGGIRNPRGSLYCSNNGRTIYSYGQHYPIARRIGTKDGGVVFLTNPWSSSLTTNRHRAAVCRAIHGLGRQFAVDPGGARIHGALWDAIEKKVGTSSITVADWYAQEINTLLTRAAQPRIRATTRGSRIEYAQRLRDDWEAIHALFSLPCSVDRVPQIPDELTEYMAAVRKENAARARVLVRREAEAREHLGHWRDTGEWPPAPARRMSDIPYPCLRIDGGLVRSSHGPRVPVEDAKVLVRMIPRIVGQGALDDLQVGPYRGVEATTRHLVIGCHTIPWVEIRAFCDHAGWDCSGLPSPETAPV